MGPLNHHTGQCSLFLYWCTPVYHMPNKNAAWSARTQIKIYINTVQSSFGGGGRGGFFKIQIENCGHICGRLMINHWFTIVKLFSNLILQGMLFGILYNYTLPIMGRLGDWVAPLPSQGNKFQCCLLIFTQSKLQSPCACVRMLAHACVCVCACVRVCQHACMLV